MGSPQDPHHIVDLSARRGFQEWRQLVICELAMFRLPTLNQRLLGVQSCQQLETLVNRGGKVGFPLRNEGREYLRIDGDGLLLRPPECHKGILPLVGLLRWRTWLRGSDSN